MSWIEGDFVRICFGFGGGGGGFFFFSWFGGWGVDGLLWGIGFDVLLLVVDSSFNSFIAFLQCGKGNA